VSAGAAHAPEGEEIEMWSMAWPDGSTVWLDRTQAPAGPAGADRTSTEPSGPQLNWSKFASVMATLERVGAMRWGRTSSGMAIWATTKMARGMAMAGTMRRTSIPTVTPRAKAKAAE